MNLKRLDPIFIARHDGKTYRIDPPSRGQLRKLLALDPEDGKSERTQLEADARWAEQLRILIGESGIEVSSETREPIDTAARLDLDSLDRAEELQIFSAIMGPLFGYDPQQAVSVAQVLSFTAGLMLVQADQNESSNSTGSPSQSPSTSAGTSQP